MSGRAAPKVMPLEIWPDRVATTSASLVPSSRTHSARCRQPASSRAKLLVEVVVAEARELIH